MATLTGTLIKDTYDGLLKTTDNQALPLSGVEVIQDGLGNSSSLSLGQAGNGASIGGNLTVSGNYYSTDGAISLTNGDIVTGGHIAINSGNAATSFSSNANNLIVGGVDSVAHQGLTIGSYSGATGNIFFADGITGDEQYRGLITYNHTNDKMYLGAGASNQVSIDEFGNVDILKSGVQLNFADNGQISCWDDNHRIRFRRSENILEFVEYGDILMSSGGSEKMRIDSAGNVGIGDTPDTLLHIKGSAPSFKIESSDTSASLNIPAGSINFFGGYSDSIEIASIRSIDASSGGVAGQLAFYTSADPDTPTERMRIDNLGNVGIGGTPLSSYDTTLTIEGTSSEGIDLVTSGTRMLSIVAGGSSVIFNGRQAFPMIFETNDIERMRIDSSGDILINQATDYGNKVVINQTSNYTGLNGTAGLRIYSSASTAGVGQYHGAIEFAKGTGAAAIAALQDGSDADKVGLSFWVHGSNTGTDASIQAMNIDSSGNVWINGKTDNLLGTGTSDGSDNKSLSIMSSGGASSSRGAYITMYGNEHASYAGNLYVTAGNTSGAEMVFNAVNSTGQIRLLTGSTERMRITSGGYLKASNTGSYVSASGTYHELRTNENDSYIARIDNTTTTNSGFAGVNIRYTGISPDANSNSFLVCEDSTTVRMRVYSDGDVWTSDAGTLTSDETLKRDITDASPKLDDIMKLRVRNYYWREDYHPNKQDKKLIGFIAQEFEEVFPNMVSEHTIKDAEYETIEHPAVEATYEIIEHAEELDEDGNVIKEAWTEKIELTPAQDAWTETTDVLISEEVRKKGIKEGKLIPIIVKAMQEQQEMINELRAEIELLKQS